MCFEISCSVLLTILRIIKLRNSFLYKYRINILSKFHAVGNCDCTQIQAKVTCFYQDLLQAACVTLVAICYVIIFERHYNYSIRTVVTL